MVLALLFKIEGKRFFILLFFKNVVFLLLYLLDDRFLVFSILVFKLEGGSYIGKLLVFRYSILRC